MLLIEDTNNSLQKNCVSPYIYCKVVAHVVTTGGGVIINVSNITIQVEIVI